jgi:threonylcarbamoyladenosine tRNA methylthiotransferase CDKAL1
LGVVKVFIQSYGCSANMNDGEIMAGLLSKAGHRIVKAARGAEVIVVNTCIVKARTENRMRNIISKLSKEFPDKKLVIAGCMPQAGLRLPVRGASTIGPHNILEIADVVGGKKKRAIGRKTLVKAGVPKKPGNRYVNIVQILEGCSGACAYCIVKQAKPVLCSFPQGLIVEDVKAGLKRGAREVWLTSQDNASYGLDWKEKVSYGLGRGGLEKGRRKSCLPGLLRGISGIEGKFWVRVGMMNPDTMMPVLDELIEAYKSQKILKFLHIPVQSGNDRILRLMNRRYSVEDFRRIVKRFREEIPEISISTDIIVGFPTESEEDFNDSMRLLRWLRPDVLNLSRFVARPKTAAERMGGQINGSVTKERSERMAELFFGDLEEKNRGHKGWKGEIYVDERGKNGTYGGRDPAYRPVVLDSRTDILGRFVNVEIVEGKRIYLRGSRIGRKDQ